MGRLNQFLFNNRTMHAISLLSIYILYIHIYIVSTRGENPDYFSLWNKFFILFEKWNEIRTKEKFSIELFRRRIENPREIDFILRFEFEKIKILKVGREFFF